jgi:uncharacterized membrane protein YozB (DUF420 family)
VTVDALPPINATLNGLSAILLLFAYVFARLKRFRPHAYLMISALITSTVFLACYLTYHYIAGEKSTKQMGLPTWLRTTYLAILLPHLLLATVMLPMIFLTLRRAYRRDWANHRRIAVPTFWVWLYVSVTGVVIYWMLYHLFPMMQRS